MLMAIDKGRVSGCNLRQSEILHFETTVPRVVAMNKAMIFYDRNATLAYSIAYTDLNMLPTAIAWNLLTEAPQLDGFCKWWHNRSDTSKYADRMERRQAEFLVKDAVDLRAITRIGVIDLAQRKQVEQILNSAKIKLPVAVMPEWYF